MNDIRANEMVNIDAKINEADVYQSMGLIAEAAVIYEQILSDMPDLDSKKQEEIKEKLERLEKKSAHMEQEASKKISSQDLSYIKKALAIDEDVSAVLDSAVAFKELGLFTEASSEFEKLFKLGYPAAEIIPELVQCYLEIHPQAKVIDEIIGI